MSTIKSSDEHLTINADGSGKDIKFQANGVEKASISSAGAFTSTTIDATKLTGDLPAISGANLTGVGVAGISSSADATAITIDSSEQVGIGTTSPNTKLHVEGGSVSNAHYDTAASTVIEQSENVVQIVATDGGGNAGAIVLTNVPSSGNNKHWVVHHSGTSTNDQFEIGYTTSAATNFDGRSATPLFAITTDGSIHCPTSTASSGAKFGFGTDSPSGKVHVKYDGWNGSDGIEMQDTYGGSYGTIALDFNRNGSRVGTIQTTLSATQYNTSSDYRLKENVDYDWDATTRLKQLKPARFNFIADDTNTLVDGFIAHEVQDIVPEAVSGEKDAMTAEVLYAEGDEIPEGKSVGDVKTAATIAPQGIDQSKLVPLLVKTIQELEARIAALEA